MRTNNENRAEKYIRNHERFKKWVAFALCLSLITGTITLYILNKPATAMTEEGAKQIGIVLETADSDWENGMIEEMNNSDGEEDVQVSEDTEYSENTEEDLEEWLNIIDGETQPSESEEEESEESQSEEGEEDAANEASSDEDAANEASSDEEAATEASSEDESADEASSLESSVEEQEKKSASVKELKSDVVITVLYEDIQGKSIEESKELNVSESFNLAEEAKTIEGYRFSKGTIGEAQITELTKKTKQETVSVSDTESGEDAEDATEVDEESTDSAASESEAESELESEEKAESLESTITYTYYEAKTLSGETIEITEDADLHLTYYKANTKTEFAFDGNKKVSVKAVLSDPSSLPEGVELVVSEITSETNGYNYDAYMKALNDNAESIADDAGFEGIAQYTDDNTLMYDIAFMFEGKEYEPAEGTVNISIEFKDNQLTNDLAAASEEEITVVHLPLKTEVMEAPEISSTQEATDITAADIEVKTLVDASAEVGGTEKIEFSEESFSIFAVTKYQKHDPGSDNFKSVLGDAINFGITADVLGLRESESNFAVKELYAIEQQYGNDLTNPAEQTFMAGTVSGNVRIKGYPAYFIVPGQYAWGIKHMSGADYLKFDVAYSTSDINQDVDDMLTYVRTASADLASRTDNASLQVYYEGATPKYYVNTTGYAAGTYYITLNDFDMRYKLGGDGALKIFKNSNQTIVFNVKASSDINLHKYQVSTDRGQLLDGATLANSNNYSSVAQSIIWNFVNTKNVTTSGSVAGVFISGRNDARFINASTSAGWLAFHDVYISSGEWHNTYNDVKQISGTAQLQAYKNIDGEYSEISGFNFALYRQNSGVQGGWEQIATAKNGYLPFKVNNTAEQETTAAHNVIFSTITYGNDSVKAGLTDSFGNLIYQYTSARSVGESETFIYKIVESEGTTDTAGNSYHADETVYYAKVTVTVQLKNYNTKTVYYRVSAPVYYMDEACTVPCGESIPTFNNTTKSGSIGISLYKYLNGGDPGDLTFNFTVRVLMKDGTLKTLTNSLTNSGANISYTFDYNKNYVVNDHIYLVITENDITDKNSGAAIKKDDGYIVVRVDNLNTDAQEVRYYKAPSTEVHAQRLEDGRYPDKKGHVESIAKGDKYYIAPADHAQKAAFFNTGSSNLRIHKMVVNDYGSKFVRDNTGSALLSNVMFRITNNATGNYIVFKGFTGHAGDTGVAVEYDASSHRETGNKYVVTYNQSAQWTIADIPAGTYTVDEVADGVTMSYDPASNSSTAIEATNLSRVTKYSVTEDDEEVGNNTWKTGGNNWRAVFAVDVSGLSDQPPVNVKVGSSDIKNPSHTQTVQVCNFYSIPIGPIQVSKNFAGGVWDENMQFTFKIEPTGYSAYTSERNSVSLSSQPMPTLTVKNADGTYSSSVADTVTVSGADAVRNDDGTYTAIAQFESIPFRYEGDYYYKITEVNTGIDGIMYDETVYYVKLTVSKKWTWFYKTYTYDNMTHPAKYRSNTTLKEHFYYLGADVTYAADENFNDILAICSLNLDEQPDTSLAYRNQFTVTYSAGSVYNVDFNNTLTGNLTVRKVWADAQGTDISDKRTSLTLDIWQKTADSEWTVYSTIQLSTNNSWTQTISSLPIFDEHGNLYQYSIKEPDQYMETYLVSYTYDGVTIAANVQDDITIGDQTVKDTGYVMKVGADGKSYGEVVITNESVYTNTLPSTGGAGTAPYVALGLFIIMLALAYRLWFKASDNLNEA
ncbi:MAG: Cna B-type domain-containing protein [Butyrivibrio sp.]|nr:Cna B-type domain-containing protein [Butyrivibrio sp.]